MTPEQDIAQVCASVCRASGHWPYTHDAELYIGYRPAGESFTRAGDRLVRANVTYDIVICAVRGDMAEEMERTRYALYAALHAGGWTMESNGPETWSREQGLFLWPVTAVKGFALDTQGMPKTIGGD